MFKGTLIAAVGGCALVVCSCNHAAEKRPVTEPARQATAPMRQSNGPKAAALRADAAIASSQKSAQKNKSKGGSKTAAGKTAASQTESNPQDTKQQETTKVPGSQPQSPASEAAQKPDPVALLIGQVEKQYQQGQAEYQAGHLESAKVSFDKAVDMLLQSPIDIRSEDRLQNEFDKIIEGVNQLEMVALKEGDGFTEQQTVPAPIT